MSRETFVYRDGRMVLKAEAEPMPGAPFVLSDTMDATWHPANGKHYDSKAEFRRATKAAGCIEVGDQSVTTRREPPKLDRRQRAEDIRRSIHELSHGR